MLDLSRVTLLFVETQAHAITKRVIDDCLTKATFGDVLVYSDKPELIPITGSRSRYEIVPFFPDKVEAGKFYYSAAMAKVETDFALMLEWDGGIYDPSKWKPEFFNYDYIGAPWNMRRNEQCTVGNGGFTLMSKRFGHFICENAEKYPACTDMDVCRNRRQFYDEAGFRWPDRELASYFSWELGQRNPDHFGFHGAFNWPSVLPREELLIRAGLLTETPYLLAKMHHLVRSDPELLRDLPIEQANRFITVYGDRFFPMSPLKLGYVSGMGSPRVGVHSMSPQQRAAYQLAQLNRRQGRTPDSTGGLKA
jgi:Protein of unknown function (DUF5672)